MSWTDSGWNLTVEEERDLWMAQRESIEQNTQEYLRMYVRPRNAAL